ncbi:MAG: lipid-binding SYLF domain-containing protein [Pararhizobium sp.]
MRKTTMLLAAPLTLGLLSGTAFAAGTSSTSSGADSTAQMNATTSDAGAANSDAMSAAGSAGAAATNTADTADSAMTGTNDASSASASDKSANTGDKDDAKSIMKQAVKVVKDMKKDPHLAELLKKSKGIYIVPDFGRGALIVGGRGGAGVMLAKHNGTWSSPAFYDFGAVSIGAQAGGSAGSVAFILMSQDAVKAFKSGNQFSLNSEAGLSIIDYSTDTQASAGKGDIVFWSDTAGAYAGATVSVSDLDWDDGNNRGFYGKKVTPKQVISGKVTTDKAAKLKQALQS